MERHENEEMSGYFHIEQYCDPGHKLGIAVTGSGLESRASLGCFTVKYRDIIAKASEHGLDAREAIEELSESEYETVLVAADVAALGLVTVHGLFCLNVEIGDEDGQAVSLPPVLPLSLGDLSTTSMQDLIIEMRARLTNTLPPSVLHAICAEHKELRKALQNSSNLRQQLEDARGEVAAGFDSCWEPIGSKFPYLRLFACGLATVFPGSSSVESDFSILAFDKGIHRSTLADISIEGQFHARQWKGVECLEMLSKSSSLF
jgi:hypothetical protein